MIFERISVGQMMREGIRDLWPDRHDPTTRATIRTLIGEIRKMGEFDS